MIAFLTRRILSTVPTLVGITLLAFAILNVLPSDPMRLWSGGGSYSAEAAEHLRSELRLDRGPLLRYASWSLALLQGDLGRSLRDGRQVGSVIADALPLSLLVTACAVVLLFGRVVLVVLFAASSPRSASDRLGRAVLILLYAVPSFASALFLQQWLSVRFGLLPLQGISADGATVAARAWDVTRHLVLPAVCLALSGWALVARFSRAAFRSILGREFLTVARGKGLSGLARCG